MLVRASLPDSHRLWSCVPTRSRFGTGMCCESYNPAMSFDTSVWADPGSLATTTGLSVDFSSSGY